MDERTKLLAKMAATLAASGNATIDGIKAEVGRYALVASSLLDAVEDVEQRRNAEENRLAALAPRHPGAGTVAFDDPRA